MDENGRWKSDSWMDQRLERLNALYERFGRDGLKEFKDANLLLWWKQLALRDGKASGDQKRRLELEIKDLADYLKGRERAAGGGESVEQRRSRGRGR